MNKEKIRITMSPTLTNEFLQKKEPFSLHLLIFIICTLIIAGICWICFGKMEVVVKADGIVRPKENISTISNIVSGKITKKLYKPGQIIFKDETLYLIDKNTFETQLELYLNKLTQLENTKKGLNYLSKSIKQKQNMFPKNEEINLEEFIVNYKNYKIECQKLELVLTKSENDLKTENSLPENSTTKQKKQDLKYQRDFAEIEYKKYMNNFQEMLLQSTKENQLEIEEIKNAISQTQETISHTKITSPVSGTIMEISSLNEGDFVLANQQVLKIIPFTSEENRIELQVSSSDIGKIKEGYKIKYRFPAFPYYDFKGLTGTIKTINPDVSISESGSMYFTVIGDVDTGTLKNKQGESYFISSGLSVQARIIQKEKRIIEWLLEKINIQF